MPLKLLITIFTGLLAIVAAGQLWVIMENERASIAPRAAVITSPIGLGETIEVAVIYENTGRLAAFNLTHAQDIGGLEVPLDALGVAYWDRMPLPPNTKCPEALEASKLGGRTAYAGQKYSDFAYVFTNGAPPEFFDRKMTFYVQGCFAYRTLFRSFNSPYCLFLYPAKNVDPTEWEFRFCPPRLDK